MSYPITIPQIRRARYDFEELSRELQSFANDHSGITLDFAVIVNIHINNWYHCYLDTNVCFKNEEIHVVDNVHNIAVISFYNAPNGIGCSI